MINNELLKNEIMQNDYIENRENVANIMTQCEFDLIFNGVKDNQYNYTLKINDINFNYFEGFGNKKLNNENKCNKIINAFWCLLSDWQCLEYSQSEYDFICEYGYNENAKTMQNGHKIYNDIKNNNTKLLKCFNKNQIEFLIENIQL